MLEAILLVLVAVAAAVFTTGIIVARSERSETAISPVARHFQARRNAAVSILFGISTALVAAAAAGGFTVLVVALGVWAGLVMWLWRDTAAEANRLSESYGRRAEATPPAAVAESVGSQRGRE